MSVSFDGFASIFDAEAPPDSVAASCSRTYEIPGLVAGGSVRRAFLVASAAALPVELIDLAEFCCRRCRGGGWLVSMTGRAPTSSDSSTVASSFIALCADEGDVPLIFVGKARVLPEVIKNETKQLLEPLRSNNNRLAEGMEEDVGRL